MTPDKLDHQVVARRLRLMRETLDDLRPLGLLDAVALRTDPVRRAAVERFIQVLVDLAADINAHIVVFQLGSAPTTTAQSFHLAAEGGVLPVDLADRMATAAGLRNLLVHRYGDIDIDLLSGATGQVIDAFDSYVGHVARWLSDGQAQEGSARPA